MSEATKEELAQGWLKALTDVDHFYEICTPDCRVWHSADDKWMSLKAAIDAVHDRGGLPEFTNSRVTITEKGFFAQTSGVLKPQGEDGPEVKIHLIQIATVEGGKVVQAEEYIGPETDLAV
ncbi:hypothetical protein ABT256_22025 [Amycolatopsis japonica]|uniref:hypothetical protein n=1 Tax=Amycolatopsis japonica TaxID=208439 RepID=UPI00332013A7